MKTIATLVMSLAAFAAHAEQYANVRLQGDYIQNGNQMTVEVTLTNMDRRPVVGIDVLCVANGQPVLDRFIIGIMAKDKIVLKETSTFTGKVNKFDCFLSSAPKRSV